MVRLLVAAALLLGAAPLPGQDAAPCVGRWTGSIVDPRAGKVDCEVLLREDNAGRLAGGLRSAVLTSPLVGRFDAARNELTLDVALVRGNAAVGSLALSGDRLRGEAGGRSIDLRRRSGVAPELPSGWLEVVLPADRPRTVDRPGLDAAAAAEVDRRVLAAMRAQNLVGVSVGHVAAGELVDVRSYGWEDFASRRPATAQTRYRWASISKPLTAVACMQLAERGALDLDRDVRDYVPEFPAKDHAISARQLLGHLGGITHYGPRVVRTERDYDVEHPFADRVLALDMFKETPLAARPGTRYHYSTHGYVLLGAVVERAGKKRFSEQIAERIAAPLDMATLAPDHAWVEIPHRTAGYVVTARRRVYPSPDSDRVSWKLAGGGWISSVVDLGLFAAAVARGDLLQAATWKSVAARQRTLAGERTRYGLGFRITAVGEDVALAHSGGQERTSTYLVAVPARRAALVVMCNTQHASLGKLAHGLLEAAMARR